MFQHMYSNPLDPMDLKYIHLMEPFKWKHGGGGQKTIRSKGDPDIKSPVHKVTHLAVTRKYLGTRILPGPLQLVHRNGRQCPGP